MKKKYIKNQVGIGLVDRHPRKPVILYIKYALHVISIGPITTAPNKLCIIEIQFFFFFLFIIIYSISTIPP